jgi:YD repeat-containing protein
MIKPIQNRFTFQNSVSDNRFNWFFCQNGRLPVYSLMGSRRERRITEMTYDARNNLKTIEDALGKITTCAYDSDNRLLSLTDPQGEVTTFTYDQNGLLLQEIAGKSKSFY